ncbi:ATP-binding protein [Actinoplanes sp. NEAU-A12]|uniref:ATP-binding protein n=1 Tax=Actinoplanes sandaracinus TaxID=3045177 RepID=A0ABT6WUS0_9ACTN|nr:ATP-binding protein [Actinoplanes sandaracinus]MDI6103468.1 ATP-binding protein [Actinoplanes sandaracinus]
MLERPAEMFDREREWAALSAFATDPRPGALLGVVSGRRRQGKTFLLRSLCQATGGFYFPADEAADRESLNRLGALVAEYVDAPAPLAFDGWHQAIDALLRLGRERRIPVVIDEFPYLVRANPQIPSVIQNALAPLREERDKSRASLLLCGSAMSFMGRLLSGSAPLRGRAGLELMVPTLDHQLAAQFWGIEDHATALMANAVVGGTPAYRREFARDDTPAGPDDFDAWVVRTVLSPVSPLFREARYLLADEPDLRDAGLYHSVLAAIASGNSHRGGIASYLGRKAGDLAHPLTVLEDCGLVTREPDAFRDNRTTFRIAEPLVAFYHAVMRPIWSDLEHTRDAGRLWQRSRRRFVGNVLGPHFEQVCRYWTRHLAGPEVFGDYPNRVSSGTVNDPAHRTSHEVDIAVFGLDDDNRQPLLAIGEVKWGDVMGLGHLDRLRRIRSLLTAQGRPGAETARLACFSGAGFTGELRETAAADPGIVLIDLAALYRPG